MTDVDIDIYVHIDIDRESYDYMRDGHMLIDPIVCFCCYRSRERSQEETGGQADLTVELVPWETCSIA